MSLYDTPDPAEVDTDVESRPSPVVDSAKVGRYIYSVGPLLVAVMSGLGYATADEVNGGLALLVTAVAGVAAVINFVVPVIRARRVRALVTPVADPRDNRGRLLRPITITASDNT